MAENGERFGHESCLKYFPRDSGDQKLANSTTLKLSHFSDSGSNLNT